MIINWVSDSILVSAPRFHNPSPSQTCPSCSGSSQSLVAGLPKWLCHWQCSRPPWVHTTIPSFSLTSSHIPATVISSIYHREIATAYTNSWSDAPNTAIITYLSLSCGFNVYLTTHIVFHMAQITQKIGPSRSLCHRIAYMFVQSTLFYLVPTLVFIALCAQRSLSQNLFFPIMCQAQASYVSHSRG
jgi:hypothetical protein